MDINKFMGVLKELFGRYQNDKDFQEKCDVCIISMLAKSSKISGKDFTEVLGQNYKNMSAYMSKNMNQKQ